MAVSVTIAAFSVGFTAYSEGKKHAGKGKVELAPDAITVNVDGSTPQAPGGLEQMLEPASFRGYHLLMAIFAVYLAMLLTRYPC